jgi:holliday junction DNA helicase RuvA
VIGRIRGILLVKHLTEVMVDVNGLAYEVQVPLSTMYKLPEPGTEIILHTHFIVREDAQMMFGFIDIREKDLFRELIKVNGVGPRMALAILSGMAVEEFVHTIRSSDLNALVKMPGIGRKTAERLIIEMRDRLNLWSEVVPVSGTRDTQAIGSQLAREAEAALLSLGYKPVEANRAVTAMLREHKGIGDSETLIRLALKSMG